MKNIVFTLILAVFGILATAGCASLENKGVVLDSSVQGFKVTTGADTTSGTPLPNISAGWGSNLLITMPTDNKGTMEYKKKSGSVFGSIFGIEVSDETEVRITSGDSKVTVTSKTDAGKTVTTSVGDGTVAVNVVGDTVISTTGTNTASD